jgi:DHA2 family multidrug resistance protein-like MFS transporter
MRDSLPSDLPAASTEAVLDTAGAAMAEALDIGGPAGEALLLAARDAYGTAFQAAALICVAVSLAAALVAWRLLRDIRPPSTAAEAISEGAS